MGCERGNGTANDEIGKCELERWTGGWKPSEDRRGILCRERRYTPVRGKSVRKDDIYEHPMNVGLMLGKSRTRFCRILGAAVAEM